MADAISVLTKDHQEVEALFAQVEGVTGPDQQVVDRIVKELSIHDAIERQYLYPAVRDLGGGPTMADRSMEEHNEVATTLLELDQTQSGSPDQARCLAALIPLVRTHVAEEESQIFVTMREQMSAADLNSLGDKLQSAKSSAPTRPHPRTAGEGIVTKVAGAVTGPLDRAMDAAQHRP